MNGGWQRWQTNGLPLRAGLEKRQPRLFRARMRPDLVVDSAAIEAARHDRGMRIFDVRSSERFRGENEPIDPVAGHIPGAISAPYTDNLKADGSFLEPAALRTRFNALLGDIPAEKAIFYCGSGVTAAQSVLALAHAGLGEAKLYAGSWSEWITDPDRPVASG